MSQHTKVYLLKDAVKRLTIAAQADKNKSREDVAVLYEGKVGQLKYYPGQTYDPEQIRGIQNVFEYAVPELLQRPLMDCVMGHCRSKLTRVLESPTISFIGTFTAKYSEGQPIENNTGHDISVLDMPLEDSAHFINGSPLMEQFCNQAKHGTELILKFSISLEWKAAKKPIIPIDGDFNILEKILHEKVFSDCCIITSNQVEISCHRNILAAHSDVLYAMLTSGFQEAQSGRIEMTDVSQEGVQALLQYLYLKELDTEGISEDIAFELLNAAHKYNIQPLEKVMVKLLFNKPPDWFTLSNVLTLYFFSVKVDEYETLCEKMMGILKKNSKELRSLSVYQDLMEKNPKEAFELAFKLLELPDK